MKYFYLVTFFLCSLQGFGQPAEFDFVTTCSGNFKTLYAIVQVDNVSIPAGTWVAAVDRDGNIVGRVQSQSIGALTGVVILPVYEDEADSGDACDGVDSGIDCDLAGTCDQFGVVVYLENTDPAVMNCFAATISFIDYIGAVGASGTEEIAGYESINLLATPPPTVSISTTEPPCFTVFDEAVVFLPVTYSYFTGQVDAKNVKLEWETAQESENSFFEVERSVDGINFELIGQVAGAENSNVALGYGFTDERPFNGLNYYRLRQNDFDGRFTHSTVVLIDFDGGNAGAMTVFPNPTADFISVQLSDDWAAEAVNGQLIEATGRLIKDWQQRPGTSLTIDLTGVPAGIYQLIMANGKNRQVQRVVVR